MKKAKLKRCLTCHLLPGTVLTKILKGKGQSMTKKYFVLCACQKLRLFDTEKEAADAWNKANATAST